MSQPAPGRKAASPEPELRRNLGLFLLILRKKTGRHQASAIFPLAALGGHVNLIIFGTA